MIVTTTPRAIELERFLGKVRVEDFGYAIRMRMFNNPPLIQSMISEMRRLNFHLVSVLVDEYDHCTDGREFWWVQTICRA